MLHSDGLLPAVLYGEGIVSTPIEVVFKDFDKVWRQTGEHSLLGLEIESGEEGANKKEYTVLIHDIARDPIKDTVSHVDFYAVRMDKTVKTYIPLIIEGESPAVKNLDGVLVQNVRELEVEALPKDLPRELKLNVSSLVDLNTHCTVKDIPVSKSVKILAEPDEVIVSVIPPRVLEEKEGVEEIAPSEIPVAGKEKKEEAKLES